jgi:hypothetical protein
MTFLQNSTPSRVGFNGQTGAQKTRTRRGVSVMRPLYLPILDTLCLKINRSEQLYGESYGKFLVIYRYLK